MDSQLLRISFIGPDSLRSFQAWKVGNRHHIFPYLHIRFLDPNLPGEALRFLAPNWGVDWV